MIKIDFSKKEIELLKNERFVNPSVKVQQKLEAIYLKSQGLPHYQICLICDISKTTLISYLKEYMNGGIDNVIKQTKYRVVKTDASLFVL